MIYIKICLINPPCTIIDDDNLEPSLGQLYIASVLRENGYEVQIYPMTGCKDENEVNEKIKQIPEADVYGITVYCTNYNNVKKIINHIRDEYENAFTILGGPNATALPEFTLKDSKCNFIIVGEGEDAFLYLTREIHSIHINGELSDFIDDKIIYGQGREDIDSYPMPAYDLIDFNDYTRVLDGERVVSIISSRGCDRNCTHCNSVIMGGGSRGKKKVRYRSPENVIKEITYLKYLGFKKYRFNDDIFTSNPALDWFLWELKELNIEYRIFARVEDLTEKNCRMLSESGCKHVSIGLESLNPENLKFLRKSSQIGKENNIDIAKKYGMMVRVYFILGLPADSNESVKEYMEKAAKLNFDEYALYPLIPYPGTAIWNEPEKYGYTIIDKDFTKYIQTGKNRSTCFVLDHKNFNHEDVERWVKYSMELLDNRGKIHNSKSVIAK